MAIETNGIAIVNDLIYGKGLRNPAGTGFSPVQCPTKDIIMNNMGGNVSGTYSSNQLVKYSDITKRPDGVLFTVTIDNKRSSPLAANLNIAYRFPVAPGTHVFGAGRQVGYTTNKGVTNHNTGPFDTSEMYGSSNVLLWTGPSAFSYSYSAIVGISGITYSSSGSGIYNGTNTGHATGTNLEYITLFSQSIQNGDSISLTITIN